MIVNVFDHYLCWWGYSSSVRGYIKGDWTRVIPCNQKSSDKKLNDKLTWQIDCILRMEHLFVVFLTMVIFMQVKTRTPNIFKKKWLDICIVCILLISRTSRVLPYDLTRCDLFWNRGAKVQNETKDLRRKRRTPSERQPSTSLYVYVHCLILLWGWDYPLWKIKFWLRFRHTD